MDTRTNAVLQTILNQRNNAFDTVANMAGEIAELQDEIRRLKEQSDTLLKEKAAKDGLQ